MRKDSKVISVSNEIVISSLFWKFAERCGAQGVQFVVSIVLARVLLPESYGVVAIVTAIIKILDVFIDSGLASAIIQKKDADDVDYSTVFYFNILLCLILYGVICILAPIISKIYGVTELTPILRVLGLSLIISGVKNIQTSLVSKNLQFKKFFFSTLVGTIISAIIGIVMAYKEYGVWALVFQHLSNSFFGAVVMWLSVRWRPIITFSFSRLRGLLSYGWKILASNLIDKIYENVRQLLIGLMYSIADLAYYTKGMSFPWLIIENINASINSVLLPTMSVVQDDNTVLRTMTRNAIKNSMYIMTPMMIGLFFIAETFIVCLLTEKWIDCVPYLRIFCVIYVLYPLCTINQNAILAKGRSDIYLKLELSKKIINLLVLFCTMWFGVMTITVGFLLSTFFSVLINVYINKKMLGYLINDQIRDIVPSVVLSVFMGVCISLVSILGWNEWVTMFVQIGLGISIYLLGSKLMKIDSYDYIIQIIKMCLGKGKIK